MTSLAPYKSLDEIIAEAKRVTEHPIWRHLGGLAYAANALFGCSSDQFRILAGIRVANGTLLIWRACYEFWLRLPPTLRNDRRVRKLTIVRDARTYAERTGAEPEKAITVSLQKRWIFEMRRSVYALDTMANFFEEYAIPNELRPRAQAALDRLHFALRGPRQVRRKRA